MLGLVLAVQMPVGTVRQAAAAELLPSASLVTPAPQTGPIELSERRTRTSKTFRNPDGTLTTSLYGGPIHYRAADGVWRDLDRRIVSGAEAGYAWRTAASGLDAAFAERLGQRFLRFRPGRDAFDLTLVGALPVTGSVSGSAITYKGALPGVDLRYDVLPEALKETLILTGPEAPSRFRFQLAPPAGSTVRAEPRGDGGWSFYTSAARLVFGIEPAVAAEVAEIREGRAWPRDRASIDVSQVGEQFVIDIVVDSAWLSDPARRFPVVVDPIVTLQPPTEDASFRADCPTCFAYLDDHP